jgi:hypothetical protein
MQKIFVQNVPDEWEQGLSFATDGAVFSKYFIDGDSRFLTDFLSALEFLPVYLTFTTYNETDEICQLLMRLNVKYTRTTLKDKVWTYSLEGGLIKYFTPCFKAIVESYDQLKVLIEELYWLPQSNMFFSISFTDNLILKSEKVKRFWGKNAEISIPTFIMDEKSTFIVINWDGDGFFFYSSQDRFNSIDKLQKLIPNNFDLETSIVSAADS